MGSKAKQQQLPTINTPQWLPQQIAAPTVTGNLILIHEELDYNQSMQKYNNLLLHEFDPNNRDSNLIQIHNLIATLCIFMRNLISIKLSLHKFDSNNCGSNSIKIHNLITTLLICVGNLITINQYRNIIKLLLHEFDPNNYNYNSIITHNSIAAIQICILLLLCKFNSNKYNC